MKENRDSGESVRIRELAVEPLTGAAFQAFGEVIEAPGDGGRPANDGTAQRYDDVAALALTAGGGRPQLSLFRVCPARLPLECRGLERHPLSSQAFVPVGTREFLRLESRDRVPDHSWLSRTRARLPHEVHTAIFDWVLALSPLSGRRGAGRR